MTAPLSKPALDPDYLPPALWTRAYRAETARHLGRRPLILALQQADGSTCHYTAQTLPHEGRWAPLNHRYVERLLKTLLWMRGACQVTIEGDPRLVAGLQSVYSATGSRAFDADFMGRRIYRQPFAIGLAGPDGVPPEKATQRPIGRHTDGCRIGFDLGGSDRKWAAVKDGEVLGSGEIPWSPYFESDPAYHVEGIRDTLRRAASLLPRIDAIGGSAAGVYVENEPRVASLFRGVGEADFEREIRPLFKRLADDFGNPPLEVANDGEVTALAGSMALKDNAVLGFSMGTSLAGGFVTPLGGITTWLNELAFIPVDYREDAPVEEWSGDRGCGATYFSQQAVGRLLKPAGISLPEEMPLPEKLVATQKMTESGDPRARAIFQTIGTWLGWTMADLAGYYDFRHVLLLGRVTSGMGGSLILENAQAVLRAEFPEMEGRFALHLPGETSKRLGQAVAAASLPARR